MALGSYRIAIACAALLAGPFHLLAAAAVSFVGSIPAPIPVEPAALLAFLILLLPAAAIGFLVSILPLAVAVGVLSALCDPFPRLRHPAAWTAAGAAGAALLMLATGSGPVAAKEAIVTIATGMACLRTARAYLF